jgi:hypothetical protein
LRTWSHKAPACTSCCIRFQTETPGSAGRLEYRLREARACTFVYKRYHRAAHQIGP